MVVPFCLQKLKPKILLIGILHVLEEVVLDLVLLDGLARRVKRFLGSHEKHRLAVTDANDSSIDVIHELWIVTEFIDW
jgi:hypothetical protein